ncbi:MAG: sodium/proline symporter [Calditrichaeota bacterium]|nr:MAG: sodium/proline symporter [Calditrichota bacterium]MBL1207796.1 sodium/proline symporter [Calditrichota bacterium]NOG47630.1 sodium/proline symporter [Calditrichota bacterium]
MNVYAKLSDPIAFTVFLLTLLLPIGIGLFAMHKTKNQSDFFIGGRVMNKVVVALSAVSSGRSSWLVLGLSGMAYSLGTGAVWAIVGYIIVEAFQFVYLGKKLREETQARDSITLLDYFDSRFADNKNTIRIIGAIIIGLFMTAYVAAQFNAGAKTLATALDVSLELSLIISGLLILVYMVLGGFVAVAYNDVVRAIIMLIGLIVLPVVGIFSLGGTDILLEILNNLNPAMIDPFSLGAGAIIGFIGIGLGSPGQPHIVVRYMSIDNSKNLTYSAIVGTAWNIILGLGALSIGLLGRAVFPEVATLPDNDPEMIYLVLSSKYFGTIFYGLLVGGIFAAILSTADSQLLVVASTFVRDIYEKVLYKNKIIAEADKLRLSRIVVVLSGIIAISLAYIAQDLVFWLVLFAWGGLGASFGPALILSLYWQRTTKAGIIAGMITGTLITIIWKLWLKAPTGIYELIPAFFGAFLVIIFVSLMSQEKKLLANSPVE